MSKGAFRKALIKAGYKKEKDREALWLVYRSRRRGNAPDMTKDMELYRKGVNSVLWIPDELQWDYMEQPH